MSRGNYHLTIATTPEALTEDDVTPSPDGGESKREIIDKYHQGLFLISENEALWVFFSMAQCCGGCCKQDNYFCIFNGKMMLCCE